ncbi:extensin-like [Portunus trituberculatus]|uniref:extensin-like n=1 Tax=Portunus trituberculatus TaxID=210409 RepID=UPI001E1CDDC6|nr:extensin-like [Portunus trituberculatus]
MPSRHRPAISDTLAQVCQECINYVNTDACLCSAHLDAAKQINAPPNDSSQDTSLRRYERDHCDRKLPLLPTSPFPPLPLFQATYHTQTHPITLQSDIPHPDTPPQADAPLPDTFQPATQYLDSPQLATPQPDSPLHHTRTHLNTHHYTTALPCPVLMHHIQTHPYQTSLHSSLPCPTLPYPAIPCHPSVQPLPEPLPTTPIPYSTSFIPTHPNPNHTHPIPTTHSCPAPPQASLSSKLEPHNHGPS